MDCVGVVVGLDVAVVVTGWTFSVWTDEKVTVSKRVVLNWAGCV